MSLVKLSSLLLLAMASRSWADAQVAQPSAEATPNSQTPATLAPSLPQSTSGLASDCLGRTLITGGYPLLIGGC
jgi:hypothetical protein